MATNEEKAAEIKRIHALVQAGYAGTLPGGNIVDRREHPEAVPMQKNTLLGVPEPKQQPRAGASGVTVNRDSEGNVREVRYLTDDRDARDGRRLELVIGWGNNGDWYVVTVPEGGRSFDAVRLCTSGGASSNVPGLTVLVAKMFNLLASSGTATT